VHRPKRLHNTRYSKGERGRHPHAVLRPEAQPLRRLPAVPGRGEGARALLPACYAQADDGMVIRTTNEKLERIRKTLVELLMSDHPMECQGCSKSGRCELQKLAERYGITESESTSTFRGRDPRVRNASRESVRDARLQQVHNVRTLYPHLPRGPGVGVYDFVNRGFKAIPGTPYDKPMQETRASFAGSASRPAPPGPSRQGRTRTPAGSLLATCSATRARTSRCPRRI